MAATRAIDIRTELPGPRSRAILERLERVVAAPLSVTHPVVIEEGRGATITDVDGNTFIDFTGGVGCLNVGHTHASVVAAAQEQLARFAHTDFTIVPYEVYVTLAERLLERAPFRGPAKAAFFNAGTEAVENAVKFARSYTHRQAVIAFEGAFHGRTLLSLSLTSKTRPYKAGLGPFAPEVYRVPFPTDYRGPSAADALAALERALTVQVAAENVAAIVVEPVQGEGGFLPAPQEFMEGLRRICDDHGIVLVVDEVQTGFGRTGQWFGFQHAGIVPDVVTMAKAMGNGFPVGAVWAPTGVAAAFEPGDHGSTYSATALAASVVRVVLAELRRIDAPRLATERGAELTAALEAVDGVVAVRGQGLLLAAELAPGIESAGVYARALQAGLVANAVTPTAIRFAPPITVSTAEIDEAVAIFAKAVAA